MGKDQPDRQAAVAKRIVNKSEFYKSVDGFKNIKHKKQQHLPNSNKQTKFQVKAVNPLKLKRFNLCHNHDEIFCHFCVKCCSALCIVEPDSSLRRNILLPNVTSYVRVFWTLEPCISALVYVLKSFTVWSYDNWCKFKVASCFELTL